MNKKDKQIIIIALVAFIILMGLLLILMSNQIECAEELGQDFCEGKDMTYHEYDLKGTVFCYDEQSEVHKFVLPKIQSCTWGDKE